MFLVILGFLAILAVVDLFVGVSNDAVNFLNSAIGSRVASFKVIITVASVGVLAGSTFSSGMMEIARSGVFNPQLFTFNEILIIFLAVMITDVLMLDAFNSLGLPTSTTVSIVFELLGGAVAVALIRIATTDIPLGQLGDFINSQKALAIVSGILVSVVVAFVAGVLVQYVTRLIFPFHYDAMYRRVGGLFGGLSLTAIFYFLIMKGAKGASFMKPEYLAWLNEHSLVILLTLFVGLSVLLHWLMRSRGINIFKIIILAGTFSLAFAFAGNDLVNFMGVPLAAWESWQQYAASGVAADAFTMEGLRKAVHTPTIYLLLSGVVMVLTLWFSKKAHRVVRTSINLSSSTRGEQEQFGSSLPGRLIVRAGLSVGETLHHILPASLLGALGSRMRPLEQPRGEAPLPFDQVRAAINLVVASILIASATSLKLPLSTTYVTFMVAMGSSFADGAWNRESAVYRVSGVLTVISGWFLTAMCAFSACALVTFALSKGGSVMVVLLMAVAVFSLVRSNFFGKEKEDSSFDIVVDHADKDSIRVNIDTSVADSITASVRLIRDGIDAFQSENEKELQRCKNAAVGLFEEISRSRGCYYRMALRGGGDRLDHEARHIYYRIFNGMKELSHDLRSVLGMSANHIANRHRPYEGVLAQNLEELPAILEEAAERFRSYARGEGSRAELSAYADGCSSRISQIQIELLQRIDVEGLSMRSSDLYLNYLQFARAFINRFTIVALLERDLNEACRREAEEGACAAGTLAEA
ncbi:inorganic phosphate transporter [uncultured Bilophila sp.]|uniref:inorganic phosphate transporter n=1 Tax=uncultured Bilophila sp. TaxID=529385 RepID=UPI0026130152|nr:inorganic phosphate transporter [uncultured Bilophila sp.]